MGQEWDASAPWTYFADHCDGALGRAVTEGRKAFLAQFPSFATPEAQRAIPDPCAEATFRACVLDHAEAAREPHAATWRLHRDLLHLRRDDAVLRAGRRETVDGAVLGEHALVLRWRDVAGDRLLLLNLGDCRPAGPVAEPVCAPPPGGAWRLVWSSEDPSYGGHGAVAPAPDASAALPGRSAWLFAGGGGLVTPWSAVLPWHGADDPTPLRTREWLVTNGLGGYASGTLLGVATRKHHGLFVPCLPAPRGRVVVVPRVDEELVCEGRVVPLGGAEHVDGLASAAHRHLVEYRHEWHTPAWVFAVAGRRLRKRIVMPWGENATWIEWTLLDGPPLEIRLRPFVSFRQLDAPPGGGEDWPYTVVASRGRCEIHPFEGCPPLRLALRPGGAMVLAPRDDTVCYAEDRDRGYPHVETLHSPGWVTGTLAADAPLALVLGTEPWEALELAPGTIVAAERQRHERLLAQAPPAARDGVPAQLVLAADQFIVFPGSRLEERTVARAAGEEVRTVIAGYHWFTDWGRDTMIALEGLTLCTGRHREARAILTTFARYVVDGLLPNLFPEGQRTARHDTVDATLWWFHAIDRYVTVTGDDGILAELLPVLEDVVAHHLRGTRHGIGVDPADGLLREGEEGLALTWMDARYQGWVVTPRRGKPVEIQALWHNALRCLAGWAAGAGRDGAPYAALADRVAAAFNARFWYVAGGHCFDVVDGPTGDDPSFRPNQIFACALRHPVLEASRRAPLLRAVRDRLLTPVGLRTLAPDELGYRLQYAGDLRTRDGAYHQGTVWPWLLGHFLDAWRAAHPGEADVWPLLRGLEQHLAEAGMGTVSEVFDAEPPHVPRACIAQAWSVAELLRSWLAATSVPERARPREPRTVPAPGAPEPLQAPGAR
jgi:predicted glycogen debranching enzyme